MNIRPYTNALRKAHGNKFVKVVDSKHANGRVVALEAKFGARPNERTIAVQLWSDGAHRVSHFLNGCSNTLPTGFADVPGMLRALQHELTRTDHPNRSR